LWARRIVEYFHKYKVEYNKEQELPKPTIEECIQDLMELFDGGFASGHFKDGVAKAFRSTGTMHDNNGKFVDLNSRKARNFSIAPAGTVDEYSRDARDITPVELFDKFTQGEDDQDFIAVDDGNDDNIE